jgi:hypothetical protein
MDTSIIWRVLTPARSVARLALCEFMVCLLSGLAIYLADGDISATPDNIHQAQFALDLKAKVLPLYEKVFDIEYKLPKLDTLVVSCKVSVMSCE